MNTSLTFPQALDLLLAGQRVTSPMLPDDAELYLVQGSTFTVNRAPLNGIYPEGTQISYKPHIDIAYADGTCGVWSVTQEALFATWYTVND
jgi:hypothetical protein